MSWISWLEARVGFLGVPRLMLMIASLNALVFVLYRLHPTYIQMLLLIPERVAHGEVWRLISYIFVPEISFGLRNLPSQILLLFFYLWFLVWIGDALEQAWGAFRLTLFYVLGMVGVTIATFFFGDSVLFVVLLNSSLFFAFATLYPNVQLYLFLLLPIKVKWLAFVAVARLLFEFVWASFGIKAGILISLLNYFIFFGPIALANVRNRVAHGQRRRKFDGKSGTNEEALHRCVICKRTENDGDELEFRVARDGEEYCLEHLPK